MTEEQCIRYLGRPFFRILDFINNISILGLVFSTIIWIWEDIPGEFNGRKIFFTSLITFVVSLIVYFRLKEIILDVMKTTVSNMTFTNMYREHIRKKLTEFVDTNLN